MRSEITVGEAIGVAWERLREMPLSRLFAVVTAAVDSLPRVAPAESAVAAEPAAAVAAEPAAMKSAEPAAAVAAEPAAAAAA
jgi:hypothetical protein